jgi:hypothetical protein
MADWFGAHAAQQLEGGRLAQVEEPFGGLPVNALPIDQGQGFD